MKKKCFLLLWVFLLPGLLTACGGQEAPPPEQETGTGTVELTVWLSLIHI